MYSTCIYIHIHVYIRLNVYTCIGTVFVPKQRYLYNGKCIGNALYMYIHVLMRDEKEGRSKQGQTNNMVKQHSTPKAVTFPKKNELPQVYTCTYM